MELFYNYCDATDFIVNYLVGAGLAEPEGVRVEPFAFVADPPTERRAGLDGVDVPKTRLVGMRDCPSSKSNKKKVKKGKFRFSIGFSRKICAIYLFTITVKRQV